MARENMKEINTKQRAWVQIAFRLTDTQTAEDKEIIWARASQQPVAGYCRL